MREEDRIYLYQGTNYSVTGEALSIHNPDLEDKRSPETAPDSYECLYMQTGPLKRFNFSFPLKTELKRIFLAKF